MNPLTPPPQPAPRGFSETESLPDLYIMDDSPGDCTIRPMRSPDCLRIRPDQPPQMPGNQQPPKGEPQSPDTQPPNGDAPTA